MTGLNFFELSFVIQEHLKGDFHNLSHVIFAIICQLMSREFLEGVCKVATTTRSSASIESKPSYKQHSTVGILLGSNLPKPVIRPQFGYKELLAEEFLDVSLRTNIHAELLNDNLEEWILTFECSSQETIIHLELSKGTEYLHRLQRDSRFLGISSDLD